MNFADLRLYSSYSKQDFDFYQYILNQENPNYNEGLIVPPYSYTGQQDLLLLRPVPLHTHYTEGVVIMHVQMKELFRLVEDLALTPGSKLYVIDELNRVMISQDTEKMGSILEEGSELHHLLTTDNGGNAVELEGTEYQLTSFHSASHGRTYATFIPMDDLTAKSNAIRWLTWGIVFMISGLLAVVVFVGSHRLNRPLEHLRKQLDSYMPELQAHSLRQLLAGEWKADPKYMKRLQELNLPLQDGYFFVSVVDVDQMKKMEASYPAKDLDDQPVIFSPRYGHMVMIFSSVHEHMKAEKEFEALADRLRAVVKEFFPFTVSVSKSKSQLGYLSISKGYEEALTLLSFRLLLGDDKTITNKMVKPSMHASSREIFQLQKKIIRSVLQCDLEQANQELNELVRKLPDHIDHSEKVLSLFSSVLIELDYLLQDLDLNLQDIFAENLYDQLLSMYSLTEVEDWFAHYVFPTVTQHLEKTTVSRNKKLVLQVTLAIHEGYHSDLPLQSIADQLHISPSQLSRIFKAETKQTFSEYLIQYRMNKAAEWLQQTDMSIKSIADKLRYTNVQNFTRVFKQIMNITPGEYRKQAHQNEMM